MHDLVRQNIEMLVSNLNDTIEWTRENASRAAQTLSTSDERIQELEAVRASWQELLDA